MANQRKYFKYSIAELEEVFENPQKSIGILEELKDELSYRKTQRAKKLFARVQSALDAKNEEDPSSVFDNSASIKPQNSRPPIVPPPVFDQNVLIGSQQNNDEIDWASAFDEAPKVSLLAEELVDESNKNNPLDILNAWTAIEVFSPQTYKRPQDLQGNGSVAYLQDGEPWFRGEKSRPNCNLYYIVYLGAVELEKATEKLLSIYQDKRVERPTVQGKAALGTILVNKHGIPVPETGIALSSFGWAYGQALNGNLEQIKHWETAEKILLEKLHDLVYQQDENGEDIPLSISHIQHIYKWLVGVCAIPEDDLVEPSFSIRLYQAFSKGEPEAPLLNSFYLLDLQRTSSAIQSGLNNNALLQYMGISKPREQFDLLRDKSCLEDVLQPKNTPLGRWPSRDRYPLVLLQQAAVNLANRELTENGLFSVNGPPGTGKTTLLRDIVAHNVVERAIALCAFEDVNDAFSHFGKIKIGRGFVHLYVLSDAIRGYEMLVASSNNKAVENISKELPLASQVANDLPDFSYFKTVSDALSDDNGSTWGMIAAVLGNTKNRSNFANKVWWDKQCGLQTYFKAITGQITRNPEDYDNGVVPPVIEGCDAPENQDAALQRWTLMRRKFRLALTRTQEANHLAQKAYESQNLICSYEGNIGTIESKIGEQTARIAGYKQKLEKTYERFTFAELELNHVRQNLGEFDKTRPGFISRIFQRAKWNKWKQRYQQLHREVDAKSHVFKDVSDRYNQAEHVYKIAVSELDNLNNEKTRLEKSYQQAISNIQAALHICEGVLVTQDLWDSSHKDQQLFTPNFLEEAHRIRDDLFVAAIQLHKAFIDAAAKQVRQNLSAFFFVLGNGKLSQENRRMIPHLWSTAFLFTPVMSTTFASVGLMLKDMPVESLGWLLIDEAGQAIPQAAIGAILRSKRVVAVGDPLQIEPVVTLPLPLVESIFRHYRVSPYQWGAPYASVQTLSDEMNPFGASIPRDIEEIRIGAPLLVHRRCENPMFKISNELAYNGQMVLATKDQESALTDLFGKYRWFDIKGHAQEKWCPEEGEFVARMILDAAEKLGGKLSLFVITPFKIVEQSMRRRMEKDAKLLKRLGIENPSAWITDNIGTVHTFQGKEAQGVILLLGAPSPTQNGARHWATTNVNLLNVAVSRAKQNFYVVGNHELWSNIGNMKTVSRHLN